MHACPWCQVRRLTLKRTRMRGLTNLWGPARPRKVSFRARLPTSLPGIAFTANGRVCFRQDLSTEAPLPLQTAKSAALAEVYKIAKEATEKFAPEAVFHAEQSS